MFRIVPTLYTGVKTTFGRFSKTVDPGLRLTIPFMQKIHLVSNKLRENSFRFEVKTKDNVFAKLSIAVQHRIRNEDTEKAFYSLENPESQMNSYIENVIRSAVAETTLSELFTSQDVIGHEIMRLLSNKMSVYGYTIENALMTTVEPSEVIKNALNNIEAAKREREAAKEKADADYICKVREAEADRDRKILQGEGISGQRKAIINGYQQGIEELSTKFGLDPKTIIDFVLHTQRLDMIETIGKSPNAKTIFIDYSMQKTGQNDQMLPYLESVSNQPNKSVKPLFQV